MADNVYQLYEQVVAPLSSTERLQLATMILNGLVQQSVTGIDDSDTWTEQDQSDIASYSLQYALAAVRDDEAITE